MDAIATEGRKLKRLVKARHGSLIDRAVGSGQLARRWRESAPAALRERAA
jgi:hypothetical protein